MPVMSDQLLAVGPPCTAQLSMTARAWVSDPDWNATWSMAASCAIAPAGVCGNPVGTCAGPVAVAAGIVTTPGSAEETALGCEASSLTLRIAWAASSSRGSAVDEPPDPPPPSPAAASRSAVVLC